MRVKTAAKINLALGVTGKLPNGYHDIESVFQTVGLYDEVEVKLINSGIELSCDVPDEFASSDPIPCDERNIAYKAAKFFFEQNGMDCGCRIHIKKGIPSQAGMGGGSADCAAALLGIRRLLALPVSDVQLHETAAALGADVPFFLRGGTVLAEGIGEKLTPLEPIPAYPLVIAKGDAGISTPEAYRRLDALGSALPTDTDAVLEQLKNGADALFSCCGNHFDAITDLPEVICIRQIMRAHGLKPVLSGSGAAVFAGCADPMRAQTCADALKAAGLPFVTVCQTTADGILF